VIIDPRIIDTLESCGTSDWSGRVWRHVFAGRDPTLPSHAGGRWAPAGAFGILYTSCTSDGARSEGDYLIAQYSTPPSRQRLLCEIDVRLEKVVDLTIQDRLQQLGVDQANYKKEWGKCPEIGAAANFLGYQGLLAPSARSNADNLMILTDQLNQQCSVECVASRPLGKGRS
jgi:RES domain-containing protein